MSITIKENYEFLASYSRTLADGATNPGVAIAYRELAFRYDAIGSGSDQFASPKVTRARELTRVAS